MKIYPAPIMVWAYHEMENDAPWAELVLGWYEDGTPAVWHCEKNELVPAVASPSFKRLVPDACVAGYRPDSLVAWAIRHEKGEIELEAVAA